VISTKISRGLGLQKKLLVFMFLPLSQIRKVFITSAGNRNAVWPEKKTRKKKKEVEVAENAHVA
tara:strand:+ start:453 stop:644 length:192 start_codon:yes stop_codon:yes gene_type:complete